MGNPSETLPRRRNTLRAAPDAIRLIAWCQPAAEGTLELGMVPSYGRPDPACVGSIVRRSFLNATRALPTSPLTVVEAFSTLLPGSGRHPLVQKRKCDAPKPVAR